MVTHDQEEALTLSDRLAVVNQGRVEQVCQPREVYEKPLTRFVAEFIGSANFLPVNVRQIVNGKTRVDSPGGPIWVTTRAGFREGEQVELSLRPERLWLTPGAREGELETSLPATLLESVFMGPITRFLVALADGQKLWAEKQNLEDHPYQPGDAVFVNWDVDSGALVRGDAANPG